MSDTVAVAGAVRKMDEQPPLRIDSRHLEKSLRRPRSAFSFLLSTLTTLLTFAALVPLFSVVLLLFVKGGARLGPSVLMELPPAAFEQGEDSEMPSSGPSSWSASPP